MAANRRVQFSADDASSPLNGAAISRDTLSRAGTTERIVLPFGAAANPGNPGLRLCTFVIFFIKALPMP